MSSTAECIHGFEPGFCDVCFPSAPPERPRSARVPTARAPRPARPGVATRRSAGTGAPVALLDQRAYHVTHIVNLPGILSAREVRAIEGAPAAEPVVDASSALTRELRRTAEVPPTRSVAAFVPFALSPSTSFWDRVREGAAEPRASQAAFEAAPADFVVLAAAVRALGPVIVADDDAAGALTRFASTPEQVLAMLGRLHGHDAAREAEVLVPEAVPLGSIDLIGVANEPVRDRVRALLSAAGVATRVAVYPPWFQPAP